jgi:DNA segregation ATPase FtsK/SpoIIIE, S-DNA-T family
VARTRRVSGTTSRTGTSRSRTRSTPTTPRKTTSSGPFIAPDTLRSLVGILLLVAGAVTLIALFLPEAGILNRYVTDFLRPLFGQGAWLLAVLLLVAGALVERAPKVGNGWGVVALGGFVVFLGGEGLIHLLSGKGGRPEGLQQGGGAVGQFLSQGLSELVSPFGAFVVLAGVVLAGILLLFDITLRAFIAPFLAGGRAVGTALGSGAASAATAAADARARRAHTRPVVALPVGAAPDRRAPRQAAQGRPEPPAPPVLPTPMPSPAPVSQTVWMAPTGGSTSRGGVAIAPQPRGTLVTAAIPVAAAAGVPGAAAAGESGAFAAGGERPTSPAAGSPAGAQPRPPVREWVLPAVTLLDPATEAAGAANLDHERNVRIIEEKLRSFQIPAVVVATNTGPVVTQYEVRPDVRIKLSRIEALADDLAMALAARSIRIEAPIPGRDVVGIEIPNHDSEVVGFRAVYEDAHMADATSKLTFALGRDVSGKAFAVDLARMPHLLIAGATGSGKSVCVNALITSILMRAKPGEVDLVLVDLKRVELAPYEGLPHLRTGVIMEAHEARAALAWAVGEMEDRYRRLAASAERNIAAYNASIRVAPEDRLPYIIVVIDELADLMMREGRKVEDPIVKLAQKARAVGIHLVLATQRPSVNVVTGLIKANVPSRIAFAMASNVDSRTVLDAPGAEDLIGRGDMLYQPADLPRPVRLQGVFVSDPEVRAVTDHWRAQEPEPRYDPAVLTASVDGDEEGSGQFGWLAKLAEDELTARAADLVVQTGKASTSMMQTKLKVGFNRASRLMDELERFGIVGPQDPRNPAVPRIVYGPDNWVRGAEDIDAP